MLDRFSGLGLFLSLQLLWLGLLLPVRHSAKARLPTLAQLSAASALCPDDLDTAINTVINRPQFRRSRWGILVQPLASESLLYAHNADRYFIPASNVKLLTTAAALRQLGANYRIRTSVYRTEATSNVTSLRIVGRGDPTLTSFHLQQLAQQLKQQGIRRLSQLTVEEGYLPLINPTWEWEDVYADYGVGVSSLILNQNAFTLTILPRQLGQPVQLMGSDPVAIEQWHLDNRAIATPPGTASEISISGALGQPVLKITGQLAADARPDVWHLAVAAPAPYFLETFRRLLWAEGITVDSVATAGSTAVPGLEIATILSPPLSELIQATNRESNNLFAEVLLQQLGSPATAGLEALQQTLTQLGVAAESFRLADGSGLSRHNLVSPQALVQTLRLMAQSSDASLYLNSLPVAGESGTLQNRFLNTPLQGNLRAKTGTLRDVSALSGYLELPHYQTVVFSILLNHSEQPLAVQRQAIDEIVLLLSQLRFC